MANLKKYHGTVYQIQQAYIGSEGRIRKRTKTHHKGKLLKESVTEYFFTYKRKLKNAKGSLELEMKISEQDFDLAWHEERIVSLNKTRICLNMHWHETWEVDFFKHDNETYFILAECELPSNKHAPKRMPDIVNKHLIYVVPDNDARFKNKQLCDPNKVAKLLQDISVETLNGKIIEPNAALPLQGIFSQ